MASRYSVTLEPARLAVQRRLALIGSSAPPQAQNPPLRLLANEGLEVLARARRHFLPPLAVPPSADPKVVILLPGFAASPRSMRYMARQLERAGHKVKRWGMGRNYGPTPENFAAVGARVEQVHARYGTPVVLVGWSLGGLFAREVAKRHADSVAKVVTMGTPFSHTPWSNNVWRAYQLITGHRVDAPPVEVDLAAKPPVETVALWSPRDGVIAPRSACGRAGERDRAVALRCTHMGFCDDPAAIRAVLAELG